MTLGVYSNNFISRDKYTIKDSTHSNGADADGHNSFLEEFIQDEPEKKLKTPLDKEESPLIDYSIPSHSTISDYIDNFLLINAEQVACTNMTSHLIRSDELKETLGFLNTQAAKTMFKGKKRPNFNENNKTQQYKINMLTTRATNLQQQTKNFFSTGIDASTNNFFIK